MPTGEPITQAFVIKNELGLHARPAMLLVQAISRLNCSVVIEKTGSEGKEGLEADAKSIMGVLTLAAEQGSQLIVRAEGPDAEKAVHAIAKLIEDKFGED